MTGIKDTPAGKQVAVNIEKQKVTLEKEQMTVNIEKHKVTPEIRWVTRHTEKHKATPEKEHVTGYMEKQLNMNLITDDKNTLFRAPWGEVPEK